MAGRCWGYGISELRVLLIHRSESLFNKLRSQGLTFLAEDWLPNYPSNSSKLLFNVGLCPAVSGS